MGDYCTLAMVRTELAKAGTAKIDDAAISERIPRVTGLINTWCEHSFDDETVTNELRSGDQVLLSPDNELIVSARKGNVRSVTSLTVSMDFRQWTALDLTRTYIEQTGPLAYIIHVVQPDAGLVRGARLYARVSYAGGFAPIPDTLAGVASRWTAFLYMKRQAPFEITAFPDVGQVAIPSAVPSDIVQALRPWVRVRP